MQIRCSNSFYLYLFLFKESLTLKEKRSRFDVYFDILQILYSEKDTKDAITPTKIAHMANLPYDRFRRYLNRLIELGMVRKESTGKFIVTEKGLNFVQEHKRMTNFLRSMGLLP